MTGQPEIARAIADPSAVTPRRSRDAIITKLAATFGPHKAYDRATRTYEPDGNDAEGSCMIAEPCTFEETFHVCADDEPCECQPTKRTETQLRALSYGEIADALADLLEGDTDE